MKIVRGVEDIKELIPFMNKVFRKNFPKLLPKLYTSNKYSDCHYKVLEGDKLIGAIASIPNTVHIYDDTLEGYGVGMVSCHPRHRGKGVMSTMLKTIIADAEAEGADFMYLDGNRQRYEYYGFYPLGYRHTFTLTTPNFEHMKDDIEYTFVRLNETSPLIEKVIEIYNSKDVRYTREDFYKTVSSWNIRHIYAILNADGKVVGHLATKWLRIVDFATTEPQNTPYIVKAFAKNHTKYFGKIDLYPHQVEEIRAMSRWAQSSDTVESTQFKIINMRHVVEVLLKMKARTACLVDFDINIEVKNKDSFRVTVHDNNVAVGDYLDGLTTYSFSESEVALYLFSPSLSPYSGLPFSLPLFSPICDNV